MSTGSKINIMKPQAICACNEKIATDLFKIIRNADRKITEKN